MKHAARQLARSQGSNLLIGVAVAMGAFRLIAKIF